MRKTWVLLFAVLVWPLGAACGEYLINDTGGTVYGLCVVFSEPVTITDFGDVLMAVESPGEPTEFVFSGGELEAWDGHWFNWEPTSAAMLAYEWYTSPLSVEMPKGGLTREDLLNLGRPPTYKEIMAAIAEYPEPDEPLYVPAEDEAIWLTDLEGHADIYDNDSIKINYAAWFDKSQITKIEIYRNGIKMRFLPDLSDVLTNEQMKTFDGNPLEHTPASSHTDHAIFGYGYAFRLFSDSVLTSELYCTIKSGFRFEPEYFYAHLGHHWWDVLRDPAITDEYVLQSLQRLKRLGFQGISINVEYFIASITANEIYPMYQQDKRVHAWAATATDDDIQKMLQLACQADLDSDVRMEVWLSDEYKRINNGHRSGIQPANIEAFFDNYGDYAVHLAAIAEANGARVFNPLTEMNSLEPYVQETQDLLNRLDLVFSGRLAVEESTNHYLWGFNMYNSETRFEANVGRFWDWEDTTGVPLLIEMSCWTPQIEATKDQHLSEAVQGFVSFWAPAVTHYRCNYPAHPLLFGEIGVYNYDGQVLGYDPNSFVWTRDDQELADIWAACLIGSAGLGINGLFIWNFGLDPYWDTPRTGTTWLTGSWAERVIRSISGSPED